MNNSVANQGIQNTPHSSFFLLKILAGSALALIAAGAGVVLVAPGFIDQEAYKKEITQSISESTGYNVNWKGDIGLSLWPLPHAQINDLTLKAGAQQVMTLKKADVSVALMPLFSKRIEVTSVDLEGLNLHLLVDGDGRKTWVTKKLDSNSGQSADEKKPSVKEPQKDSGPEIVLSKIRIVDGRVNYSDEKSGVSHEIKEINTVLRTESLKGPFSLNGDLLWQGHKVKISLAAGKMEGNEENYPIQIKTSVADLGVKADYSGVISTASPMKAEGDINFNAEDLAATLSAVNGKKVTLSEGIGGAVSLQSGLRYQGEEINLSGLKFGLGDLSFHGDLKSSAAGGFEVNLKEETGAQEKSGSLKALLSGISVKGRGKLTGSVLDIDQSSLLLMGQDVALSGYYHLDKKEFDLTAKVQTQNADSLLSEYAPDVKLPTKVGPASLHGSLKGTPDKVFYDGTMEALQFSVGAAGSVALPIEEGRENSLRLTVKHPRFVEAVRTFQPDFEAPLKSMGGGLDLKADLSFGNKKVELKNMTANLGGTSVSGNVAVATGGEKPSVTGALSFGDLVFPETSSGRTASSPSAGKETGNAPSPHNSKGRWSQEKLNLDWMKGFDANLTVKARSLTQNLWKLLNANLAFHLNSGVLEVDDLSAQMFGGQVAMNGKVESAASPLSLNWSVKAQNLDAEQLQSALTSKPSDTLSGMISGFNVEASARGDSVSDLVQSLGGKGNLTGENIIVKGVDAAQLAMTAKGSFKPVDRAGSLFGSFKNGQTEFSRMDAVFPVERGIVTFTTLNLDGPKATIESTGTVNLPAWTIDLKNTMTVKGTDIAPFDFTIKGPLDNPVQAGGGMIENYLRGRIEKKVNKLVEKELGRLLGHKLAPVGSAPVEPSPETPLTPTAPEGTGAPSAPETAPAPKPTRQEKAEKAVKLLEGFLGH